MKSMLQRAREWLQTTNILANLAKLLGGSLAAQGLYFLSMPLITRLYDRVDLGNLGIFLSICSLTSVSLTLQYESAIIKTPTREEANQLFLGSIFLSTAIMIVLTLIFFAFIDNFRRIEQVRTLGALIWFLPCAILFRTWIIIFEAILTYSQRYGRIGSTQVFRRFIEASLQITFGLAFRLGGVGLILGTIAGDFSCGLFYLGSLRIRSVISSFNARRLLRLLKEYSNFPKYAFPAAFLSQLRNAAPLFLIAAFFGIKYAGIFELTRRVLLAPQTFFGQQYKQVFYQKSASIYIQGGDISRMVERSLQGLLLLNLPVFLIIGIFGRQLFAWVFGPAWIEAGLLAQILTPALFLKTLAIPISSFNTLNRQDVALYWNLLSTIFSALAIWVGKGMGGLIEAMICFSAVLTLAYCVHLWFTLRLTGASLRRAILSPVRLPSIRRLREKSSL